MNDDDEYEALIPDYMRPVNSGGRRVGKFTPGKQSKTPITDAAERVSQQAAIEALKKLAEAEQQQAKQQAYRELEPPVPPEPVQTTPEPIDITDPELSEAAIGRFYQSIVLPEFCNCTRCRKSFASKDAAVVVTPLYKVTEGDTVSYTREIEVVCPTCWDVMNASVEKKPSPLEASEWDILD